MTTDRAPIRFGLAPVIMLVLLALPACVGDTRANGETSRKGRLLVRETVVNEFGIYDEGAIAYLRVRRLSDATIVVRRRYEGTRIKLDAQLPARRYKLISFVRPCDGDCRDLGKPADRCSAEVRLRRGHEVSARIVTNDGSPCRVRLAESR